MFSDDDLLPISGLQHVVFCDRQAALIHVERIWSENVHTVEGQGAHRQVHTAGAEGRGDIRIVRGLALRSLSFGLAGIADVVEFHRAEAGVRIPGSAGLWCPFPVEYKKGKPKRHRADEVQLCAQALCLEEMLGRDVPAGAVYHAQSRTRREVLFTPELRARTEEAAARLHELLASKDVPPAVQKPQCRGCSLRPECLPHILGRPERLADLARRLFRPEFSDPAPRGG